MNTSKNQNVLVAAIDAGYSGKNIVRNLVEFGALCAICDPLPAGAEWAERHRVRHVDFATVLADTKIPAVAIAAPAVMHGQLTRDALEGGKHVFVERSLAPDVMEAEETTALAARPGLRLMVGHLLQYHPAFQRLRVLVRGGNLGRLLYGYSNRLDLGKVRWEEYFLWSFAPHDISMLLTLVGTEPNRVTAESASYLHRQIADVTTTHLSFPGGEQAHVFVSWLHPFKEQRLVVIGDQAMAVFNHAERWERKLVLYRHKIQWRDLLPVPERAEEEPVSIESGEPLRLECLHFLECISSGTRPRTDGAEGVRVLRVLTTASEALKGNRGGAGLVTLMFFIFARPIVDTFTNLRFHGAYVIVGYTAGAVFFVALWSMLLPGLYFAEETMFVPFVQGPAAAITLTALWELTPVWGIKGAAISILLGTMAMNIFQLMSIDGAVTRSRRSRRSGFRLPSGWWPAPAGLGPAASALLVIANGAGVWLLLGASERRRLSTLIVPLAIRRT